MIKVYLEKIVFLSLFLALILTPKSYADDDQTVACKAVGIFAGGVAAFYISRVGLGISNGEALVGATFAGTQALSAAGLQHAAGETCEIAKDVWKEATEENYERYRGNKRPGELAIGGAIGGVSEDCFLSVSCEGDEIVFASNSSMSVNTMSDLFYYNYQLIYMDNYSISPPSSFNIK